MHMYAQTGELSWCQGLWIQFWEWAHNNYSTFIIVIVWSIDNLSITAITLVPKGSKLEICSCQ